MSDNYGPGFTCLPEGDGNTDPSPGPEPVNCDNDEYKYGD